MLTLAVDTSCLTASCSVVEDGKVLAELTTQHKKTHSQKIIPMIKSTLNIIDRDFPDIALYAAAIGPGSFTGLRIGVVTIKGLAYANNKPVCGISTLDALAYTVPDFDGIILPMLDARNNQVFTAIYRKNHDKLDKLVPEMGIHIDDLIVKIGSFGCKALILGDAVPLHLERMKETLYDNIFAATPSLYYPRASSTALLAERDFYLNKSISPFELKPMYLRKSQAERMKELAAMDKIRET